MQNINTKLEYWKNRLLDLGKRSRLINCPLPKDGKRVQRHSLLINMPTPFETWALLTENNKSLDFPVPLRVDEEDQESEMQMFTTTNGIQTNQSPNETYKTLRGLMKKASEFTQEKGLNALHLAFGFLHWVENGIEGQEMRSPLLLLPVSLEQDDLFSPIRLSQSDEEITTNYSLEQKLFSDFGIKLPALTEDISLIDYLNSVEREVASLGWKISKNVTQLSLFSFMKINMYRDLERNADKICGHHLIRAVNGEALSDGVDLSGVNEYNHDNVEPQDVLSVVDADSSQQDAILLAKRGASFVLQGPPGTGKSQTITNIIAELIADGKKVLFVSEKMAALEVVYRRLTQVGLAPFCLTLHSHNAKRREILDQFDKSIKLSRQRASLQQDAYNRLHSLKEVRNALNQYSSELHTPIEPLGKTIYQVNGYLAQFESYRNIDYVQVNAVRFTPALLARCESALEELTRIVSKSGYQQDNPWSGCVMTEPPTFEFRQRFLVDSEDLIMQLNKGRVIFSEANEMLGTNVDFGVTDVAGIQQIYDSVKASPKGSSAWLIEDMNAVIKAIDGCVEALGSRNAAQANLEKLSAECESIKAYIENGDKAAGASIVALDSITVYNDALDAYKTLLVQRQSSLSSKKAVEKNLASCNAICDEERALFEETEKAWQSSRDKLAEKCELKILTLDIPAILSHYRVEYRSFIRRLGGEYRRNRKAIHSYYKIPGKTTYEQELELLEEVNTALTLKLTCEKQAEVLSAAVDLTEKRQSLASVLEKMMEDYQNKANNTTQAFNEGCQQLGKVLNEKYDDTTDYYQLRKQMEWCLHFQELIKRYSFGASFVNDACNCNAVLFERIDKTLERLLEWQTAVTPVFDKFISLFDNPSKDGLKSMSLTDLSAIVNACKENFVKLECLIDYRSAEKQLEELGIGAFLAKAREIELLADEIIPVFKKCFFRSWIDAVIPRNPAVREFRRLRQDERIALFKELDKSHLDISKAIVISKLISRLPNFDAFSANGEIALLRKEMAKQRKLMPTRLLIAALPNLLPALKPCIMMSPLSVSTYLGSSNFEFDVVLFDEASQVRTEDAIGAIFRSKQVIIAGDSKQLPPTDFFNSSMSASDEFVEDEEGVIDDAGAYESLLDEAAMLPTQTLLWHYRSRHEHLIAFSNTKIYQGNLITFPSSVEEVDGMGVEYIHVSGGFYDRGGRNGNKAEAKRVADLVFEHFHTHPKRSLGIIAFGEVQQSAIQDAIDERRRANPTFEPFFKEDRDESLFIKNLETVQGDERDTIIFSIGYAPDATGKFIMNFGPLSRDGGERRLNVAVTRARYNLKLVGSIMPTDIDPERISGQGPKLLRLYIDFAINGVNAILGEITEEKSIWFDSPFEVSVYDFLTANGYDVVTQVGCSGYRIDMAVRHPKYPGRFAIGIECDGAMYHSARTARERDRLRQTVLEDMGWKIYRIWSTDWIKDRHTEGARLLDAAKMAIDDYREIAPASKPASQLTDFLDMSTQTAQESMYEGIQQKYTALRSRYYGWQANDIPRRDIAETMLKVLSNDFGLDKAGLFKETALYGYGWQRQGSVIKRDFEAAYSILLGQGLIVEDSDGKVKRSGES
ncbi:MAG: DUF4011 domain-containing protein [Oscillospiraceae bacterium]|jgi:very-short-patch-repair endonuclease|nr:DUF4011 domain-containing protein [Oscillospiraceae bacterium]